MPPNANKKRHDKRTAGLPPHPTRRSQSSAMSLNAEPSQPEERAAHDLPPKSYAAAAEEAVDKENDQEDESEDQADAGQTDGAVDDAKDALAKKVHGHQPNGTKVIRIVPAEEYEGEGQDSSPKSPSRHRRKASLRSNGSVGHKHGENLQNEVYEKHPNGNGEPLTSVKPTAEFEAETRTDKPPRRNSELKSGRQAGEGWHKSKCVFPLLAAMQLTGVESASHRSTCRSSAACRPSPCSYTRSASSVPSPSSSFSVPSPSCGPSYCRTSSTSSFPTPATPVSFRSAASGAVAPSCGPSSPRTFPPAYIARRSWSRRANISSAITPMASFLMEHSLLLLPKPSVSLSSFRASQILC
jgi:hypothetical protein